MQPGHPEVNGSDCFCLSIHLISRLGTDAVPKCQMHLAVQRESRGPGDAAVRQQGSVSIRRQAAFFKLQKLCTHLWCISMQASGMFAGSSRAKLSSSGTRVSEFITHSKCGHIVLKLGAFEAKAMNAKKSIGMSAASSKSISSAATLNTQQHSYIVSWHATEPASRRIPHRLTPQPSAPSSAQTPVDLAAASSQGEQRTERQAALPGSHEGLKPRQRWLAGQWSLFAQSRLFRCRSRSHDHSERQTHMKSHKHSSMEAACAALQMIQRQQLGGPLLYINNMLSGLPIILSGTSPAAKPLAASGVQASLHNDVQYLLDTSC